MSWELNISFESESELHKQEVEQCLDGLFSSTNMRRIGTKENLKNQNVVITYEDTGVRH